MRTDPRLRRPRREPDAAAAPPRRASLLALAALLASLASGAAACGGEARAVKMQLKPGVGTKWTIAGMSIAACTAPTDCPRQTNVPLSPLTPERFIAKVDSTPVYRMLRMRFEAGGGAPEMCRAALVLFCPSAASYPSFDAVSVSLPPRLLEPFEHPAIQAYCVADGAPARLHAGASGVDFDDPKDVCALACGERGSPTHIVIAPLVLEKTAESNDECPSSATPPATAP